MNSKIGEAKGPVIPVLLLVLALVLAETVSSIPSSFVTVSNVGKIISTGALPLHVEGSFIKDSLNNTVYLRGVNRPSGFTASCTGIWMENGQTLWDFCFTNFVENGVRQRMQEMKDAGFNVIRLIFFTDWWLDDAKTTLNNLTTSVGCKYAMRRTAEIAQEYGIYVVFTPWGKNPQTGQNAVPVPDAFSDDVTFASFWKEFAQAFADLPNTIFELWNEPAPPDPPNYTSWWNAVELAVGAIRSVSNQIIVVQLGFCADYAWVPAQHSAWGASAGNIVYSNHIYHTAGATIPQSITDYDGIRNYLLTNRAYNEVVGIYPLWIGEIGAFVADGTPETTYFNNTLRILNEWGIGYAAWEWDQPGTGWQLQADDGNGAPYPPNLNGQILIAAIAQGRPS